MRTPWRSLRRRLRNARAASDSGVPVAVDWTTQLATVPYEGRFPPPLAQCTVVEPCEFRTRLNPLSVNSTKTEQMHYVDHTVHAPAMTLEHLVGQYWFPALGLLISETGQVWRHSFLGPFQEEFLAGVKAIVDHTLPDGDPRASAASRAARPGAENNRRASPDRWFRQAEFRSFHARHRAADPSRRDDGHADAELDAEALATRADRAARRRARPHPRNQAAACLS